MDEVVPSPKFHTQLIGVPVEVSVKATFNGGLPLTGVAMKEAFNGTGVGVGVGAVLTVIYPDFVRVLPPAVFFAVREML